MKDHMHAPGPQSTIYHRKKPKRTKKETKPQGQVGRSIMRIDFKTMDSATGYYVHWVYVIARILSDQGPLLIETRKPLWSPSKTLLLHQMDTNKAFLLVSLAFLILSSEVAARDLLDRTSTHPSKIKGYVRLPIPKFPPGFLRPVPHFPPFRPVKPPRRRPGRLAPPPPNRHL